jgi:hypothetical protein
MATNDSDGQVPFDVHPPNPVAAIAASSSIAYELINQVVVADTSNWVDFRAFSRAAIEVSGGVTGAINLQFYGSLSDDNPALSGESGSVLGSAIVAKGITFVSWPGVRFIKAVQSGDPTGGALNVRISAVAP